MTKLLTALAAMTFVGCNLHEISPKVPVYLHQEKVDIETLEMPVYVDIKFNNVEHTTIVRAIEKWNAVLNGYFRMIVMGEPFEMQREIMQAATARYVFLVLRLNCDSSMFINSRTKGFVQVKDGLVYLVPDSIKVKDLYGITLHEIGHVLGAKHTELGLMRDEYHFGQFVCVDEYAAAEVAKWNGFDLRRLNYCLTER